MLDRASKAPGMPKGPMPPVAKVFETVSTATVSKSAAEAKELLFLRRGDGITMNRDRLLYDAKQKALSLAQGYRPPEAPEFRLPRLNGRGELGLSDLRGKRVLLVFSSPHCGPCESLAPELEKFHRAHGGSVSTPSPRPSPPGEGEPSFAVEIVVISKGEPRENRAKVKEHGLTFPIILQQQWEISRRYAMFATPIAYPSSLLAEKWRVVYALNPMVGVVEGFRWALLGTSTAPGPVILASSSVAVVALITGAFFFRRMERSFADLA